MDHEQERFHRIALGHHVGRLVAICRESDGTLTDDVRVAAADAIAWAVRLRDDVLGGAGLPREFVNGAKFARNRAVHGDAHVLALVPSPQLANPWDSPDILWNDPESDWNGRLVSPMTLRFGMMAQFGTQVQRADYNAMVAGRRVVVVCGLLAGESTLGHAFVSKS